MGVADELDRFVHDSLSRGESRGAIREALLSAGWESGRIDAALGAYSETPFVVPVPRPRASLSARDAFVYLLHFTTLYIVAFNVGRILFHLIEGAFPDAAMAAPWHSGQLSQLRFAVASLTVATPVFLYSGRLAANITDGGAGGGSAPRRWLTWLTLFVASGIVTGDLIAVLYNLLGGELTTRFALKALVVGGIGAGVFAFYLTELRAEGERIARGRGAGAGGEHVNTEPSTGRRRSAALILSGVVGVVLLAGVLKMGSPNTARGERLDEVRLDALRSIAGLIDNRWRVDSVLPASLIELVTSGQEELVRDPATGVEYEYLPGGGDGRYELCAEFAAQSPPTPLRPEGNLWYHGSGRHCFSLRAGGLPVR